MASQNDQDLQFWDNPNSPNYNLVNQGQPRTLLERAMPILVVILTILVAILLPLAISNHVKVSNNEEAVLETMRRIKPMLDQFKNNSGFIGPPGPPGPKGDPAPLPSGPKTLKLPDALKKDNQTEYKVTCLGSCWNINIKLKVESGDADLYAREASSPVIENSDCDSRICTLCRERSTALTDSCEDINIDGDTFYVMAVTHKPHQNGTLTFSGLNLRNVIELKKKLS